ncbi:MAG: hypothetical protein ACTSR8_19035 [Promethearchaeota archaeon]
MSFGKGFGIGFLVFVILNLVFSLLTFLLAGNIVAFTGIFSDINAIIITLLGGGLVPPSISFLIVAVLVVTSSFELGTLLSVIGTIAIPLISALITGKLAGGKGAAFGAWLLISILSAAIIGIMLYLGIISNLSTDYIPAGNLLLILILFGAINGIFYGAFAQLVSSDDLY